jgi:acetylornithine deacetylase/succinyl-diaminopimelate desuccinylase-like protein
MNAAGIETPGSITFVGTVGEEGLGNSRGVRHLFDGEMKGKIDRFVSVDWSGHEIVNVGVGSYRYRVTYRGPGGHSYAAFGMANPIHALGRAIAKLSEFQVPSRPKVTFNVGRIGGGTSINAIPFEAWAEVDMRSQDAAALEAINGRFKRAVEESLDEENRRWNDRGKLTVIAELVGLRPAGQTAADSPVVQAAAGVTKALGLPVQLREGSTDANIPMGLGVPAITIFGGGKGSGEHSLNEAFDATDSWLGTQRALLVALALAQ